MLGLAGDGEKGLVSHPASGRNHRIQSLKARFVGARSEPQADVRRIAASVIMPAEAP